MATAGWSGSFLDRASRLPGRFGCTFFGSKAMTGSEGSQKPVGKVPVLSGTELQPGGADLLRDRGRLSYLWASGPACLLDCGGLLAVRYDRWRVTVRARSGYLGSMANLSVLHPTRLETRTKESNMCASHGVLRNPKAQ